MGHNQQTTATLDSTIMKEWPEYYRASTLIFVLFLVYVVYWYLQGSFRIPALGAIRFEFIMGLVLSIFAIPAYLNNPNRDRCGLGIWVTALILLAAFMVPFSYVPDISLDVFVDRVIKFALFGLFIAAFVSTPKRLKLFIGAFLLACMKMGQEGFLGNITGSLIWENQGIPRLHGPTPNYAHPNSFSGMALGTLPFIYFFFRPSTWYIRILLMILLIFAINIVLFTGSRTGYVGLIVGLAYLIRKSKKRMRALFILILIACVVTPFIPSDYIQRAQSIFTGKEKEGHSIETREKILEDAWEIWLENPLGIGVHAFPAVREDQFGRTQDTHNLYLEIATNLGIQGLAVFSGLIITLLKTLNLLSNNINNQIRQLESITARLRPSTEIPNHLTEHLTDLRVMYATCMSVSVFLIIRLGLGFFGMDLYEIYWWFAIGTTTAVWNLNITAQHRTEHLRQSFGSYDI